MDHTTSSKYEVVCFNCKQNFDATEASWCSCLSKERSLVCPSCLHCFCKAPRTYKQKFWEDAPQPLWDAKIEEHKGRISIPENRSPDEIERPLVLIVDDEKEIQAVAVKVVESLGYSWILARDGEEGLELARRYKPELVLSDAMMPKLDGRELSLKIKSDEKLAATRVIVMTSLYTAAQYKYEALKEFKVDDYVAKPLEFTQLRALLERHLGR